MAKIIDIKVHLKTVGDGATLLPDDVMSSAIDAELAELVLVGLDADGDSYVAASHGSPRAVWLLERAKIEILHSEGEGGA